jgi:hypothetical protein
MDTAVTNWLVTGHLTQPSLDLDDSALVVASSAPDTFLKRYVWWIFVVVVKQRRSAIGIAKRFFHLPLFLQPGEHGNSYSVSISIGL